MNFQMGFWHPFGPHGGESVVEILARKQREINANGWTLWSFQPRLMLKDWMREIRLARPDTVAVFCSDSRSAKDPPGVPVPSAVSRSRHRRRYARTPPTLASCRP